MYLYNGTSEREAKKGFKSLVCYRNPFDVETYEHYKKIQSAYGLYEQTLMELNRMRTFTDQQLNTNQKIMKRCSNSYWNHSFFDDDKLICVEKKMIINFRNVYECSKITFFRKRYSKKGARNSANPEVAKLRVISLASTQENKEPDKVTI